MHKLIVVSSWYYPAYKAGGPAKSTFLLVEHLKNVVGQVLVITSGHDLDDTPISYNEQGSNVSIITPSGVFGVFRRLGNVDSKTVIYFNDFFSLKFFLVPFLASMVLGINAKLVIAPRGMLTKGALSIKSRKKKVYLRILKFLGVFSRCRLHFTDKSEYKDFKELNIDHPSPIIAANFSSKGEIVVQNRGDITLKFVTRLSEKKNLHGLLAVLHSIESIKLDIHGEFEDEAYKAKCLDIIEDNNLAERVSFHGAFKPSDLGAIYASPSIFILPTLNENYGHSIVEALSYGVPVLISNFTPWEELDKKMAGGYLIISDTISFQNSLKVSKDRITQNYSEFRKGAFRYWEDKILDTTLTEKYLTQFFG